MPMLFLPAVVALTAFMAMTDQSGVSRQQTTSLFWMFFVGGLLSGFLWLPILLERSFIQPDFFLQYDFRGDFVGGRELLGVLQLNNFPTDLGAPHQILAALSIVFFLGFQLGDDHRRLVVGSTIVVGALLFLTNYRSEWVWELIQPLQFTQFPWRLLAPASFFVSLIAASTLSLIRSRSALAAVSSLVVLVTIWLYSPFAEIEKRVQSPPLGREEVCQVVRGTQDYRPRWSDAAFWPTQDPPTAEDYELVLEPCPAGLSINEGRVLSTQGRTSIEGDLTLQIEYQADRRTTLVVSQFYYPGWRAEIDNSEVEVSPEAETGLIQVEIPSGAHSLGLHHRQTFVERAGMFLTVLGVVLLATNGWSEQRILGRLQENATRTG